MMADKFYFATLHPSAWNELKRTATPKEMWKFNYRNERLRRKGLPIQVMPRGVMCELHGFTFITKEVIP